MNCPACGEALSETLLGEAHFVACESCGGALVKTNQLIKLMEALASLAVDDTDLDAPIEPAPKPAKVPRCPGCGNAMEPFGYLGSPLAILFRCSDHSVVWGDEAALGTGALLYGRTNRHLLRRKAKDDAMRESMARTTRARAAGRSAASAQMMGLMFGGVVGGVVAGAVHDAATKKGH